MTLPKARFLEVKDFRKFQHYRDRHPPWIKLYGTLLTNPEFLQMPEAAQAQLVKLWLLASQLGHPLPNNAKLLAGKIAAPGRFYLAELIDAGFIIPCEQDASESASNLASNGASTALEKSYSLARADARSRESGERRAESSEERERSKALSRATSNTRSGVSTGGEPDSAAAPPADAGKEKPPLPPDAIAFVRRFYGGAAINRAQDVVAQLQASLNGGAKLDRNTVVRAGSVERLAAKCREVMGEQVRKPDLAIRVLLLKLADTSDDSAPGAVAAAEERQEIERTEGEIARELVDAYAWLEEQPDVIKHVEVELIDSYGAPDPDNAILAKSREIARNSLVLKHYRAHTEEHAHV